MFPTRNRIIDYRPKGAAAPMSAIVCGVDESKTDGVHLHLTVFDPLKGPYLVRGVQGRNEGTEEGQWSWPSINAGNSGRAAVLPPGGAFREDRHALAGRDLSLRQPTGRAVGAAGNVGGAPFRSHAEEIDAHVRDARERGRAEAKTLDEQVRADIAGDPVGYGDERNYGRDEEVVEDRPVAPPTHGSAVPASDPTNPQGEARPTS